MNTEGGALLDVNVLFALAWPTHQFHTAARKWFTEHAIKGWRTTAMTQAGMVRLLCNPAATQSPISAHAALSVMTEALRHPAHEFWAEELHFGDAISPFANRIRGHRQITDAYLLGLALYNQGRLVTWDRGIRQLLPSDSPAQAAIEILAV